LGSTRSVVSIQVPGLDLNGGLMYAGFDGYPTHQGNPSRLNVAPRGGVAWSLDPKTVVRAGYVLFWAPSSFFGVRNSGNSKLIRMCGAGRPEVRAIHVHALLVDEERQWPCPSSER
jgi:hypothetical protein